MKKILLILLTFICTFSFSEEEKFVYKREATKNDIDNRYLEFLTAIKTQNNNVALNYINGVQSEFKIQDSNKYKPAYFDEIIDEIPKLNIDYVDKVGESPLILAIEYKNNTVLEELLKNNVSIEAKHPILSKYPLNFAVYTGNLNAVRLLVQYHPELVNFRSDVDGWVPLEDAVLKGDIEIISFLLDNGADITIKDNLGNTAMDLAIVTGKGEVVKLLRDTIKKNR